MKAEENWFAIRLKEHRAKADMTQAHLAEVLSVSLQTVKDWERGTKKPSIVRLPEMARALGVEAGSFFPSCSTADEGLVDQVSDEGDSLDDRLLRLENDLRRLRADVKRIRRERPTWKRT